MTICHNPACGMSRNVLAVIRNSGEEPQIVAYFDTPPSRDRLVELIGGMGIPVRDLQRRKGTPCTDGVRAMMLALVAFANRRRHPFPGEAPHG